MSPDTFIGAYQSFISQLFSFFPKLIVAYLIWLIGKYVIEWIISLIDKLDVHGLVIEDHIRDIVKTILGPSAKVILFFIVLDTLGIGSNVVSALVNAFTLTIAIALGFAFGKALEPEAKAIVQKAKDQLAERKAGRKKL